MYWMAMTLWSWLQTYFVMNVCGSCMCTCWSAIATYDIRSSPSTAWRRPPSLQRVDVSEQVVGGRAVLHDLAQLRHLLAGKILRMTAAMTLLELLQLPRHVPVTHARE